jgi:hypothetical protein
MVKVSAPARKRKSNSPLSAERARWTKDAKSI